MRPLLILLILCISTSCSEDIVTRVDPALFSTYNRVIPLLQGRIFPLVSVKFDDNFELSANQVGKCIISGGRARIVILKTAWRLSNSTYKSALMAHELIHCVSRLRHIPNPLRMPYLMSPYTPDSVECLNLLGLEKCIEETYELLELGSIRRI